MRGYRSIWLVFSLVWALISSVATAEEPIAPMAAAAQQALDNPLSRLKRDKAEPDDQAEKLVHRVGQAGDLKRLQVEGAKAFDADEIAAALVSNLKYQLAARPSAELPALLEVTKEQVLQGYLHAGFLDVKATVQYSAAADGLVVNVDEGSRYQSGDVRVVGTKVADAEKLAARLCSPAAGVHWTYARGEEAHQAPFESVSNVPVWDNTQPAPGDRIALAQWASAVEFALLELGFPFAKFTIAWDRSAHGNAADLVVTIDDEGPQGVINSISFSGLTRHSEEEMRDFLKLREGMEFNGDECERVYQTLRRSCRFWRYSVEARCSEDAADRYASPPQTVDLHVAVLEYDRVPRLGEPLSETDQTLVKAAQWLEDAWKSPADVELVCSLSTEPAEGGVAGTEYAAVISKNRGIVGWMRGPYQKFLLDAAVLYSTDRHGLLDWRSGSKVFVNGGASTIRFELSLVGTNYENDAYNSALKFGFGIRETAPDRASAAEAMAANTFVANVEPVALVRLGRGPESAARIVGGMLIVAGEPGEIHIEASTGRIVLVRGSHGGTTFKAAFGQNGGDFDRAVREIEERGATMFDFTDSEAPWVGVAQLLVEAALAQPVVLESPLLELCCRRGRQLLEQRLDDPLVRELGARIEHELGETGDDRDKLCIPADPNRGEEDDGIASKFVAAAPTIAEAFLPRDSWLWTWLREYSFHCVQYNGAGGVQSPHDEASWRAYVDEYRRQFDAAKFGPIGHWVFANYPPRDFNEESKQFFARQALERFDSLDVKDDVALLTTGDHLPRLIRGAVRFVEELDDRDRETLLKQLPPSSGDMVAQFIERRRAQPDESAERAVEAVLIDWWQAKGREAVQASLRKGAGIPELPPEYETTNAPAFDFQSVK